MADKTTTALTWSAAAGAAFYLGLLVVLGQLIVGFSVAFAALGTGIFSLAGILSAIQTAGIGLIEITALAGLLVAALASQGIQLDNLYSEAGDGVAFPHHHWPSAITDQYSDATVKDGDADWSVQRR